MNLRELKPSKSWVKNRSTYLGGSNCAAILGESNYSTPLQVYLKKKGILPPIENDPIMDFGHFFEDRLSAYFEQKTGFKTRRVNQPFSHPKFKFLKANIDRQVLAGKGLDSTAVLELKTTTSQRYKSFEGGIDRAWYLQVQHYLGITGYKRAFLQVYLRDTCEFLEPQIIDPNPELIEEMTEKLVNWWQKHMVEGIRPDPQNGEDALLLYPDAQDGRVVEASAEDQAYHEELIKVRQKINSLTFEKELLEAFLKNSIGAGERLVAGGRDLITWKNQETNRLDTKLLKQRYPALCKKFIKTTKTRRFLCH